MSATGINRLFDRELSGDYVCPIDINKKMVPGGHDEQKTGKAGRKDNSHKRRR